MSAICITFGEQSENHFGMAMNGDGLSESGYSHDDLINIKNLLEEKGIDCQLIELHNELNVDAESAYVLYIPNAVSKILSISKERKLFTELTSLDWDTQYWDQRRSRVLNKHARYNLCFGDDYVEADFENKIGTIIAYDMVPTLKKLRKKVSDLIGVTVDDSILQTEGNYYYDINKTGIGYHGDAERKRVIGVNLSDINITRVIQWKWFQNSVAISEPYKLTLNSGDMYIMSEKASGFDWKKRNIPTLRHAAAIEGSKYLK